MWQSQIQSLLPLFLGYRYYTTTHNIITSWKALVSCKALPLATFHLNLKTLNSRLSQFACELPSKMRCHLLSFHLIIKKQCTLFVFLSISKILFVFALNITDGYSVESPVLFKTSQQLFSCLFQLHLILYFGILTGCFTI